MWWYQLLADLLTLKPFISTYVGNQSMLRCHGMGNPLMYVIEGAKYWFGVWFAAYVLYNRKERFKRRLKSQCPCYRIRPNGQYLENVNGQRIESTLSRAA